MKTKIPYNAGEIRKNGKQPYLIAGHIWWPVEQTNAYHCVRVNDAGDAIGEPEYIWDTTDGKWPLVEAA